MTGSSSDWHARHVGITLPDMSELIPIHSGTRHRLYRAQNEEGELVVKVANPDLRGGFESLRREFELLRTLDFPGVVKVLGMVPMGVANGLVMTSAGESSLADRIRRGPLSIPDFLHIATQLAEALAALHQARVVHRAIQPGNVVWAASSRRATLCDFASASTFSELSAERATQPRPPLTYVSPEQTGRTGRSVDSRTDLYSLGATLYEMLLGRPPFVGEDIVELAHAHIARRPDLPHELRPDIPLAVSSMVLKLLEKDPEQRYQTAVALVADLYEAQTRLLQTGTVASFALASRDVPREVRIPEKLYGRDAEMATLEAALARCRRGSRELVLIAGAPGAGKSALVAQFGRHVAQHGGLFIAGKFDQLQRSVPFSGLTQAFRSLVRLLLVEDASALETWRERIAEAVSPNGRVLLDVVPELERILGQQPAPSEVGPVEARNRFNLVVTRFLSVFARREHPLTLFLDDVQWMDPASLDLLGQWLVDGSLRHLLLLGAYRDTEVDSVHALALSLAAWRQATPEIEEIHVGPLSVDHLAQLVSEAFKSNAIDGRVLAELVARKTAGNPFFARRFLLLLHARGLIRFAADAHRWEWDVAELEDAPIADSVVDLMTQAIDRLPAPTQELLQIGSCVGHRFELGMLCELSGKSQDVVCETLQSALEDGLLLRVREVDATSGDDADGATPADGPRSTFQFAHDRVQQAAYSMLSEHRRRELHLAIGRRLLTDVDEHGFEDRLFEAVDQLDLGATLIEDAAERLRLAEGNLAAGRKAQASAAYQAAREYLQVARGLLPDDSWQAQPGLTFAIHRELAESAYLSGQHAAADELIEQALAHAPSRVARSDLYSLRVLASTVVGDWSAALHWGREGLAVFGQAWPLEGLADANEAEARAVMANVGARRIESLLDEPEVKDAEIRASMRLLSLLGPPAYFSGAEVLTFLVTRAANLSLLHGPSPYSAYAYVFYGALHNARTGEYDIGYEFGTLALALARRFADRAEESRVLEVFGLVVHGWKAPLRQSLPLVREGYRAGVDSGELAYAAFNLNSVLINGLPAGLSLTELLSDAAAAIEFAARHGNRTSTEIALPFRQFARSMRGATQANGGFDDGDFDEARFLEDAKANGTALGNFWVARLQAAYLFGDHATAQRSSEEGEKHVVAGILGMFPSAEHVFYTALSRAAVAMDGPVEGREIARQAIAPLHRRLGEWAAHCPENFRHKLLLVGAEMARLGGDSWQASRLYRAAIDGAAAQSFVQDEALAHELRAKLFAGEQEPELAGVHLRAARDRYRSWGAEAKAGAIEARHPELFASEARPADRHLSIDALALTKASQAISAETQPEALFDRILRVLVEVAGANRGAMILCEQDELTVRARIDTAAAGAVSMESTPLDECVDMPAKIIRYAVRTKEALALADAAVAEAFAADVAVRERGLRSVLCVPLQHQGKLIGLLYLENDAMAAAFPDELAKIVEVLAAQAVISLENARLHQASQQELEERTNAQRALSEADRRKDEFLAMLAHELRNPLAPIAAAADLLQLAGGDPARAQRASAVIARQVRHMTGLIDDLLDVSRVTRGLVTLQQVTLDAWQTVLDAVEQVRPLMESKRHQLVLHASPEPALVDADPKRLLQVLTNLLTNAAKYTHEGGLIRVETSVKDGKVHLCVIDNGQGMSPELLTNCFELFVQGERTSERAAGGLGIGLALVRSLIEVQGGSVRAQSDGYGKGSCFTVTLPRVQHDSASASTPAPRAFAAPEAANRLRILIVDDNEDAAEMLAMLVEAMGHETMVEHHPLRALTRIEHERPDICLLDIGLPDVDGYELARRVRTMFGEAVTLFAVTGYGQPQDRERAIAAGFDDHFTKPLDGEQLARRISRLRHAA